MLYERINTLVTRKLAGEATETEIRELASFCDQNPELISVVDSITNYWDTNHSSDQDFLEATYLQHLERMKAKGVVFQPDPSFEELPYQEPTAKKIVRRIMPWAVLPLAVTLFIIFRNISPQPVTKSETLASNSSHEIETKNGSRSKMTELPDGSKVWLNAGSKLTYDNSFNNTIREVKLTGEAYFDVVKNASKPFIVNTASAKVKVLGTTFNVRCYPEDNKIETSLIHGRVEVTLKKRPDERWILRPNEKLVLLNEDVTVPDLKEKIVEKKKTSSVPLIVLKPLSYQEGETVAVEAAWAYNKLSFKDESFLEVANKMARWYDLSFVFKNEELKTLLIYGSFAKETIHQAMEALQYSFKFNYEIKDKEVTIY